MYEIAIGSDKAITYNDINVIILLLQPLENFHAAKTFQILNNKSNNFLSSLPKQKYLKFKQSVIHNILNTDMNDHFSVLSKFT